MMQPWYKIALPRKEVREGRSFNPDEFAIHLEQVAAGTAPEDYRDPRQFFSRNWFTQALTEHVGMVMRRLDGQTVNTAPVITLVTQFGGGKTHTLAALYHLSKNGAEAMGFDGVPDVVKNSGVKSPPKARVAAFVGNAWDPREGSETPWIDVARQLAGDKGVAELGPAAKTTPPGTESLSRVFKAANAPVLLLFDEVLNFMGRHRGMAEQFYAFIQNLTVAATGTAHAAAVISLPRSQVEMTDWDMQWQDRITKVVRRVAKDLIANDETEISEVVRRRLFDEIGGDRTRRNVSKAYADWCFERRAQLPSEWTAVNSASTEKKAKDYLRSRFELCYPFHPATLSVFQRKWQALPHYQQTRGTLAMLAQWIAWAFRTGFAEARTEPLITLGSAPLHVREFQSVVLGQLGESRLSSAVEADVCGAQSHAKALDADTKGPLRDIHRRVGTAIFFESSGGQVEKVAHLPELRFAIGEPEVDTTSVDSAALELEHKSYFIRRVGSDGLKIGYKPTVKKVVNDRRASLDEETEIRPAMRTLVEREFRRGAGIPIVPFPADGASVQDTAKLMLIIGDPELEWNGSESLFAQLAEWTRLRDKSPRLYPGSLVWCLKKQGRELRDKVELWLAWKRVAREITEGYLGSDFEHRERAEISAREREAADVARDEVWGDYRFALIFDSKEPTGLQVIDLGAGHSSAAETLCSRVVAALKSQALLNETVGAGYVERHWPPAFKESGAWPLASLRQSFLNGSLTRLIDPDAVLRSKVVEWIAKGEFGLASGQKPDGSYKRVWFNEGLSPDEVTFESGVFLLLKARAESLKEPEPSPRGSILEPEPPIERGASRQERKDQGPAPQLAVEKNAEAAKAPRTFRILGDIPPELWNRLGTKLIPKLRNGTNLSIGVEFAVTVDGRFARSFETDVRQILEDLGLSEMVRIG